MITGPMCIRCARIFLLDTELPPLDGDQHGTGRLSAKECSRCRWGRCTRASSSRAISTSRWPESPSCTLQLRMFYKHKGTEKLFEQLTVARGVFLAESVSGDSAFSHATAFCQAIEKAGGMAGSVPRRGDPHRSSRTRAHVQPRRRYRRHRNGRGLRRRQRTRRQDCARWSCALNESSHRQPAAARQWSAWGACGGIGPPARSILLRAALDGVESRIPRTDSAHPVTPTLRATACNAPASSTGKGRAPLASWASAGGLRASTSMCAAIILMPLTASCSGFRCTGRATCCTAYRSALTRCSNLYRSLRGGRRTCPPVRTAWTSAEIAPGPLRAERRGRMARRDPLLGPDRRGKARAVQGEGPVGE